MDIRRALTFPFRDPRWARKLVLAMALAAPSTVLAAIWLDRVEAAVQPSPAGLAARGWGLLISLLGIPVFGYVLRITRNVVAGQDVPLPDWSDARGILSDGLLLWAVITVWSIPSLLVDGGAVVLAAPAAGMGRGAALALLIAIRLLEMLVTVVVLFVQPAAEARLAATGSLAAGLDVRAAFSFVRRSVGIYLKLMLVSIGGVIVGVGLSLALVALGWRAIGGSPGSQEIIRVGVFVAALALRPYGLFALYHLMGQAYATATQGTVLRTEDV